MKKKRGVGKGRKATTTGTDADLRRLAEAAAAEKTNSGGQRNSGDPPNGASSGSSARPKAGVSTPTSGLNRSSIGDGTSAVRAGSSDSSTPSAARNTLSGSQTSIPTEYLPSTQPPQLLRRQPPSSRLNPRQSHHSQQCQEEQHACHGLNPHHGDYELHYHQNQVDMPHQEVHEDSEESDGEEEEGDKQVEEHVVDPAEQQEYDQMLDNLMALPGRGHLSLLSPHPIPNTDITW